jgi:hypothetical protein
MVQFNVPLLLPLDTYFEQACSPVVFIENGPELVKKPGEYNST